MSLKDFVEDLRHDIIDDAVTIEYLISHFLTKSLYIKTANAQNKLPLYYLNFIQKGKYFGK